MMAKAETRFVCIEKQGGAFERLEIWVDMKTGVHYLYRQSGYSGGMTPLLDCEGKPVVSPVTHD